MVNEYYDTMIVIYCIKYRQNSGLNNTIRSATSFIESKIKVTLLVLC